MGEAARGPATETLPPHVEAFKLFVQAKDLSLRKTASREEIEQAIARLKKARQLSPALHGLDAVLADLEAMRETRAGK